MATATIKHRKTDIPPIGGLVDGGDWLDDHVFDPPEIGSVLVGDPSATPSRSQWIQPGGAGKILTTHGTGVLPTWEDASTAGNHVLLSAQHPDTAPASVSRGSLIVGNASALWAKFAVGASGTLLGSDGVDPVWVDTVPALHVSGLTQGRVVVVGASGLLVDDARFLWDVSSGALNILNGVAPPSPIADGVTLAANDITGPGTAGLVVVDELNNIAAIGGVFGGSSAGILLVDGASGVVFGFGSEAGRIYVGSLTNHPVDIFAGNAHQVRFEQNQNIGLGTTVFGTDSVGNIAVKSGVAPSTSPADQAQMWVADDAPGNAMWWMRDEEGFVSKVLGGVGLRRYQLIVKAANQIVNNSTALVDDTELKWAVKANEITYFMLHLRFSSPTNADFKLAVNAPSGSVRWAPMAGGRFNAAGSWVQTDMMGTLDSPYDFMGSGNHIIVTIVGHVDNGSTPGDAVIRWAQNSAVALDTTVILNSQLHIWRVE